MFMTAITNQVDSDFNRYRVEIELRLTTGTRTGRILFLHTRTFNGLGQQLQHGKSADMSDHKQLTSTPSSSIIYYDRCSAYVMCELFYL